MGCAMNCIWDALPKPLESTLLLGATGKMHLTGLARTALQMKEFSSFGADMLLAAWETDPLDGMLAGQVAQFFPKEDTGFRAFFSGLAQCWHTDAYVVRLQQQMKTDQVFAVLEKKLQGSERSLFHLQRAVELGPAQFPLVWARQFLEQPWPDMIAPAVEFVLSAFDLLAGDVERARDRCRNLSAVLPFPGLTARLGECEYRLGNRDRALELWREVLTRRPWDVSLLLKAYDVAHGLDRAVKPLDGAVNILLYTFNKSDEVDQALAALAQGRLENVKVTVLDNGSCDGTGAVLEKWETRLGSDVLEVITLPVNVGAPAARNWLMRYPETASRPWTIYLDDDALVPQGWLGRLGAAVQAYPDAGVWGCKVRDAELPHVIQNADLHPRPDYAEAGVFQSGEMSDLHHQTFDTGGFDYMRPCTSVTGCCHLFRTETLLDSGDFDVAFTPSQFDDLDHDLRLVRDGKMAVYQGHLAVNHMKRSGKLVQQDGLAFACGQANHDKLKAKHAGDGWKRIRALASSALLQDIRRKADALAVD